MNSSLRKEATVSAVRGIRATLVARSKALILSSTVNTRSYVGLVLMAGSFLTLFIYCLPVFDQSARYFEFHLNWYYFLRNESTLIFAFTFVLGFYHTIPIHAWQGKILFAPSALIITKFIWDCLATTDDAYNAMPDGSFFMIGMCLAVMLHLSLDHFIWRKFHGADAYDARLTGIYRVSKDLPAEKVVSMFQQTMMEKESFNTKF